MKEKRKSGRESKREIKKEKRKRGRESQRDIKKGRKRKRGRVRER